MKRRIELVREHNSNILVRHRCKLLSVVRSMVYYRSSNRTIDSIDHMNEIRELYEQRPFKGYKRITDDLVERGHKINHKRVYRLMKEMGLQAIYPKKNLMGKACLSLYYRTTVFRSNVVLRKYLKLNVSLGVQRVNEHSRQAG